jgi:hypothetical protein
MRSRPPVGSAAGSNRLQVSGLASNEALVVACIGEPTRDLAGGRSSIHTCARVARVTTASCPGPCYLPPQRAKLSSCECLSLVARVSSGRT